jgi:hypothetical protein
VRVDEHWPGRPRLLPNESFSSWFARARAAAEAQVTKAQKLMTADAAALSRLRAYLDCYGGAATLAQAERGEAPADTDQLVAVARTAQAVETADPKPKARAKKGG